MKHFRKQLLAVLLTVCMAISLLPAAAYAAVGDLLSNSSANNQALLEELEALTGQDGETVRALLEQYGLLDENGNLITDQTMELDGVAYTLDQLEALLADPSTNLSRVGYVDGVPVALGDLKTIIAIEKELQRLKETYFSGQTFEGKSLSNFNSLMSQLQTTGITLRSGAAAAVGSTAVVDVSSFASFPAGSSATATFAGKAGVTYAVDVSLDAGLSEGASATVSLGSNSQTLSSTAPTATLTYTPAGDGDVSLTVQGGNIQTVNYAYGALSGAVQFTNPRNLVFQNGGAYATAHTVRFTQDAAVPDLSYWWKDDNWTGEFIETSTLEYPILPYADSSSAGTGTGMSYADINRLIEILQRAKGYTDASQVPDEERIAFQITGDLIQNAIGSERALLIVSQSSGYGNLPRNVVLSPATDAANRTETDLFFRTDQRGATLFTSGSSVPMTWSALTRFGTDAVPEYMIIEKPYEFYNNGFTGALSHRCQISGCQVELLNDNAAPVLQSAVAPNAVYYPGQLVPVVLTFDELVKVTDSASITINGSSTFTAGQLYMNAAGNQLILWYPVQKVDGAQVTITSLTGITDIWGNEAAINGQAASGAQLQSALLRDAVTGVSASCTGGQAAVTVTLSSDTAYENNYANYHTPTGGADKEVPYLAVVTNDAGEMVGQGQVFWRSGDVFSTDITVPQQADPVTYTVTLQVNEGTRDNPMWVDLSYHAGLKDTFQTGALIQAASVQVTDDSQGNYTLSLADTVRPTLTATVYGPDGSTPAAYQSGKWSSSNPDIATIITNDDYTGTVVLTSQQVGQVYFTFTADNGTPDNTGDDKSANSQTYTVEPGGEVSLLIPMNASRVIARQNAAATVLWSSNVALNYPDADFSYTVELFEGYYSDPAQLDEVDPLKTYPAGKDQYSLTIGENVLSRLSQDGNPAYTVRVSMPHPEGSSEAIRLSALSWIEVYPEPAVARLTRPGSIYLRDNTPSIDIPWSVESHNGQAVTLTVVHTTGSGSTATDSVLSGSSGTYTLNLSPVAEGALKDTYQIMLTVANGAAATPPAPTPSPCTSTTTTPCKLSTARTGPSTLSRWTTRPWSAAHCPRTRRRFWPCARPWVCWTSSASTTAPTTGAPSRTASGGPATTTPSPSTISRAASMRTSASLTTTAICPS